MKKKDIITIIVLLVIFGIIFLIALISKDNENEIKRKTEYNELTLLTNEDIFLSVSNNISRSFEYSDYIIKNNKYENMTFTAERIYVISNLNLYKYYVEGNLYKLSENDPKNIGKEYFVLNYDIKSKAYNVETISKDKYENASSEKHVFKVIDSNQYNEFEYTNLNDKNRASMYFNDFVENMYLNTEKAYKILSTETKEKYFNTLEDFEKFTTQNTNIIMKEYGVNNNKIAVVDNNGIEYIFNITYVLEYNVTMNMTED